VIYSDCHCHLDSYQPEAIEQIIKQSRVKHVEVIISMGMDLEGSIKTTNLARTYPEVKAAVGIHPWNAIKLTNDLKISLKELAKREYVKAVGEIGLDYVRNPETKEIQKELFQYEVNLAQELELPVNIHCKEAHQDMMNILRKERGSGLKGIIHGFSGDTTTLHDWLNLGFYVSIGLKGFVTDVKTTLQEIVREIPLDKLLTETDSSKWRSSLGPLDVILVVEKLASITQIGVEQLANTSTSNLKHLLKL
jgi:TatD DNase family protein